MNLQEYSDDFFKFIHENLNTDTNSLRLKYSKKADSSIDYIEAIKQIECRRKARGKLKSFVEHIKVLFPSQLSVEQASSDKVAAFNASVVGDCKAALDMTSGLGSDALAISPKAKSVVAIDISESNVSVLSHNVRVMGYENLTTICADSVDWLKGNNQSFDAIFIDPYRRSDDLKRTYSFADCLPDVSTLAPFILDRCKRLIIKASPMLDITKAASDIEGCRRIYVVSEAGECKEILVEAVKGGKFEKVTAVMLGRNGMTEFNAAPEELSRASEIPVVPDPDQLCGGWLLEPNASLMKMRCFDALYRAWPGLFILAHDTNLLFSEERIADFPGRQFRIEKILSSKDIKRLEDRHFNILCRNYPKTSAQLTKQLKPLPSDSEWLVAARVGPDSKPTIFRCKLS